MAAATPELEPEPTSKDDVAFWLYSQEVREPRRGAYTSSRHGGVCGLYAKGILQMTEQDAVTVWLDCFSPTGWAMPGIFLWAAELRPSSPRHARPGRDFADIERYSPRYSFRTLDYAALLTHKSESGVEFDLSSVRHVFRRANLFHSVV